MIKINQLRGYIFGTLLVFVIYLVVQAFFFIYTTKTAALICKIETKDLGNRYFYACFITSRNKTKEVLIGTNLKVYLGDIVTLRYDPAFPDVARMTNFQSLWLRPAVIYLLLVGIVWALLRGLYYKTKYVIITKRPFSIKLSRD